MTAVVPALIGGAASAAVGWGLNKAFAPKASSMSAQSMFQTPKFEMPKFEMPKFEMPKFELPQFEPLPPVQQPAPPQVETPAPPPAAPLDPSVTKAAIIAKTKAKDDQLPVSNSDIVLTTSKERKKALGSGTEIRRNTLLG